MPTRPSLKSDVNRLPGIVAIALFVVFAAVFLTASFPGPQGFGGGPITASIGYALIGLTGGAFETENFLVAFEIIDLVLVAAVAAAVMLARRDGDGQFAGVAPLRADGGRTGDADTGTTTASDTDADADTDDGEGDAN